MKWLHVGVTVVAHPDDPQYVLVDERGAGQLQRFETLAELAAAIRDTKIARNDVEIRCIKNDLPAIVWVPDGCKVSPDTALECTRLDKNELAYLANLLRR